MSKAKGSDATKFRVVEVKGAMFGRGTVDGTISRATGGEEASLLVSWKVKPDCFGLKVVEDTGESTLECFDFEGKWLLKIE